MATPTGYGQRPYRAYAPHPVGGWEPVVGAGGVDTIDSARRCLERMAAQPQPPLSTALTDWLIARDESIRSSVMEGVASTGDGLVWAQYRAHGGQRPEDHNDALTLGAARQIQAAVDLGQRMRQGHHCTLEDLLDLHSTLFEGTRERSIGGVLRDGPIWIGPPGCLIDQATFVAPPETAVPDLMADLVSYLNADTQPAVMHAAIAHSQFETIHPFEDGNGRTGRALIQTVLNARGLASGAVAISTVLGGDRARYYAALDATRVECRSDDSPARSAGLGEWLSMFCDACEAAERHMNAVRRSVDAMAARWQAAATFRRDSAARQLLERLPTMPVFDAEIVAEQLGITTKTARAAIASLARIGIVAPTGGSRNRRFIVPELIELLRRLAPDAAHPRWPARSDPPVSSASAAPVACNHEGARSRERCHLPKGHRGQHRYTH